VKITGYVDVIIDRDFDEELDLGIEPVREEEETYTQLPMFDEEYFRNEAQAKTDAGVLMQQEILALRQEIEQMSLDLGEARKWIETLVQGGNQLFLENQQLKQVLGPLMSTPSILNQPMVDQHGRPLQEAVQQAAQQGQDIPRHIQQAQTSGGFGASGRIGPF
jgi:regulator of replication initiation timing